LDDYIDHYWIDVESNYGKTGRGDSDRDGRDWCHETQQQTGRDDQDGGRYQPTERTEIFRSDVR
jgi:hypothetical protein